MVKELRDRGNKVLDHFMFLTKDNSIGVITGNLHSDFFFVGYIKYVVADRKTIWCNEFTCYERVVKIYDPKIVHEHTIWKIYVPYYGSKVPIIPVHSVKQIFDPEKRAMELISRCIDHLECAASSLIENLYIAGLSRGIGITGSLLAQIHNPKYSDLDIIIYGIRESINVIEFVDENPSVFKEFDEDRLREWARVNALMNNIPIDSAKKLYRRWRRGVYRGKEYSILYNNGVYSSILNKPVWKTIGKTRVIVEIEPSTNGLNYPSIAKISKWSHIGGSTPRSDISHILSFEALYIPLFFEGGKAWVEGLLQYSKVLDEYRIIVGVREYLGRIIPM